MGGYYTNLLISNVYLARGVPYTAFLRALMTWATAGMGGCYWVSYMISVSFRACNDKEFYVAYTHLTLVFLLVSYACFTWAYTARLMCLARQLEIKANCATPMGCCAWRNMLIVNAGITVVAVMGSAILLVYIADNLKNPDRVFFVEG